jgi:hypothetical protein
LAPEFFGIVSNHIFPQVHRALAFTPFARFSGAPQAVHEKEKRGARQGRVPALLLSFLSRVGSSFLQDEENE